MTVGAKHSRNNVDKAVDRIKTRMQRRPDRLEAGDREGSATKNFQFWSDSGEKCGKVF